MRELNVMEVDEVSGGGLIGQLFGNALIGASNLVNGVLDVTAPIGQALNGLGPVVTGVHELGDALIYKASSLVVGLGQLLGGTVRPDYHFINEWA